MSLGSPPARRSAVPSPVLLLVLLFTTAVGPLFNLGLAAAGPILILELDISPGTFGLLITLLFASAALASRVSGRLADFLSIRDQLILNFGGTAFALVIASIGPLFWLMVIAMVVGGLSQVIANGTTNRVIYQRVPPPSRSTWVGVKQSGVQVSQVFAGLLFPVLSISIGWTGASLVAAALVIVLLFWCLSKLPPEDRTQWRVFGGAIGRIRPHHDAALARLPAMVWFFAAFAFLSGAGTQATNVYLSLFAVSELGVGVIVAGVALGVAGLLGVISRIWWGRALGRGRTPASLLALIAAGGVAGMLSLVVASVNGELVFFWLGVVLHGLSVLGTNVVINGGAMLAVSADRIGVASGAITMGVYAGFSVGPVGMGLLIEATDGFAPAWTAVGIVYVMFLAMALALVVKGSAVR